MSGSEDTDVDHPCTLLKPRHQHRRVELDCRSRRVSGEFPIEKESKENLPDMFSDARTTVRVTTASDGTSRFVGEDVFETD